MRTFGSRETGLLIIAISLAGLAIGFASLTSHLLSYRCMILPMWPEKVICPSPVDTVLPDLLVMIPNVVSFLIGVWIYRQQPTNRNEGEKSKL